MKGLELCRSEAKMNINRSKWRYVISTECASILRIYPILVIKVVFTEASPKVVLYNGIMLLATWCFESDPFSFNLAPRLQAKLYCFLPSSLENELGSMLLY